MWPFHDLEWLANRLDQEHEKQLDERDEREECRLLAQKVLEVA
jgi:hypothetical protein